MQIIQANTSRDYRNPVPTIAEAYLLDDTSIPPGLNRHLVALFCGIVREDYLCVVTECASSNTIAFTSIESTIFLDGDKLPIAKFDIALCLIVDTCSELVNVVVGIGRIDVYASVVGYTVVKEVPFFHLNLKILDLLLPEGPIIRIVNKSGTIVQQIDSDKEAKYTDVKFAVLANENTASAAELFTCSFKDYDRAVVVGVKTFGKGSMQSTMNLSDNRGIKMTTYHYLPPYSESYEGIGIAPDIEVELSEELAGKNIYLIGDKDDNQLKAAVDSIK